MDFEVEGQSVRASVSPMSWAHPDDKLQMAFTLGGGRGTEVLSHQKSFANSSLLEVHALVESFKRRLVDGGLVPCPECGALSWNRAVFPTPSRDPRCENCRRREQRAIWAAYKDAPRAEAALHDLEMARKGFTHCFEGTVHPRKGSDRLLTIYLREAMSAADAQALLKDHGCRLQNDYEVRELPPPLSFADAKAIGEDLDAAANAAGLQLAAFGKRPAEGDKASTDYWTTRAAFELAVLKQRAFERWYVRAFKTQRQMEEALRLPSAAKAG
jgi:hypothetical protein